MPWPISDGYHCSSCVMSSSPSGPTCCANVEHVTEADIQRASQTQRGIMSTKHKPPSLHCVHTWPETKWTTQSYPRQRCPWEPHFPTHWWDRLTLWLTVGEVWVWQAATIISSCHYLPSHSVLLYAHTNTEYKQTCTDRHAMSVLSMELTEISILATINPGYVSLLLIWRGIWCFRRSLFSLPSTSLYTWVGFRWHWNGVIVSINKSSCVAWNLEQGLAKLYSWKLKLEHFTDSKVW